MSAHVILPLLAFASFHTCSICTGWPRHTDQASRLVEPTPLSALRGRLAAVLVGGFVVDEFDGLGDGLVRADDDADGITAVCGADCPLDGRTAAVRCPAVDAHAAIRAIEARKVIAAATQVARRAVIVVSRGIDRTAPPAATVMLRARGAWLAEAVTLGR